MSRTSVNLDITDASQAGTVFDANDLLVSHFYDSTTHNNAPHTKCMRGAFGLGRDLTVFIHGMKLFEISLLLMPALQLGRHIIGSHSPLGHEDTQMIQQIA